MNKHIAESDLATPKVTTGPIMGSRKIYARPDAAPELKVPLREIALDASSGSSTERGFPATILLDCQHHSSPCDQVTDSLRHIAALIPAEHSQEFVVILIYTDTQSFGH